MHKDSPLLVTGALVDRIANTVSRPFAILGATVFLVAGGLVGWRRAVESSPRYALRQVEAAFREHNGTKLAYYMDAARVTEQVVDETVDWRVAQRGLASLAVDDGDAPDERTRTARIQAVKTAFSERVGRSLNAALLASGAGTSTNVTDRIIRTVTAVPPLDAVVAGDQLTVDPIGSPRTEHDGVAIPLVVHDRDVGTVVDLTLVFVHAPGRWQLAGVGGLTDALGAIDNAQLEHLAVLNRPIEEQLGATLAIGTPVVDRVAHGRQRTVLRLRLPIRNQSANPVSGVALGLSSRASDDDHAEMLTAPAVIPAGATATETWEFDETGASTSHMAWLLAHPDRVRIRALRAVVDSAGIVDTVRLFRSYGDARHAPGS